MKNTLLVISSFPPPNSTHHKQLVGVASYAKNTLVALQKQYPDLSITVLAEQLTESHPGEPRKRGDSRISDSGQARMTYSDNNIAVKRVWQRGSILSFPNLITEISTSKTSTVLIEFELAMFGGPLSLALFPLFLLTLKLMGKKVILVLHQVVIDVNNLHGHMGLSENSILATLINFCIQLFYPLILSLSQQVIVFDTELKESLQKLTPKNNSIVISHGVEEFKKMVNKEEARKKLKIPQNDFVLLTFGFIAWYKGTDLIVEEVSRVPRVSQVSREKIPRGTRGTFDTRDTLLIIAGGPNPNHLDKPFYTKYVTDVTKKAQSNNITITGFIDEKDIPLYFEACDVVILPYRTNMSASGPLSLAFSFGKPFLVSDSLAGIFQTPDLKTILAKNNISKDLFIYSSLKDKLNSLDHHTIGKMEHISQEIAKERSWNKIAKQYYKTIFSIDG